LNALDRAIFQGGQKTHEDLFGAVFIWKNMAFPCTHGDITRNPALIMGGLSPDTDVIITVRGDVFGDASQPRPTKGNDCFLQPDPDNNTVFALKIGTVMTSVGDLIQKFICKDNNQGA
jgi:hypothetical protein